MSIASMVDAKIVREEPDPRSASSLERGLGLKGLVEREPTEGERARPGGVPGTVVSQLVRWIPTEVITMYVAFIALFGPIATATKCESSFTGRWVGLAAFAALATLAVLLVQVSKVRRTSEPFRWPLWEMAIAPLAFGAWALSLPETPLYSICGYKADIGAFILLAATTGIAVAADALGKNP